MKRIFVLAIFLSTSLHISSQEVVYSTKQKINSKTPRFSVIGKNADGIVLRRFGKTTNILDVFDDNLNYKYSAPINPRKANAFTKGILLNQYGATSLFLAPTKENMILYARILGKKFEMSDGAEIPLDTIDDSRENTIQNYRYLLSKDKSKVLFYYPHYKGNQLSKIQVKVYSRDLLLLQKKLININEDLQDSYLTFHPVLRNNGEAIIYVIRNVQSDKTAFQIDEIHQHHLSFEGYQYKKIPFNMTAFGNIIFKYDEENKRVGMGGLKSELGKKTKRTSTGYFINFINPAEAKITGRQEKNYTNKFMYELTGKDSTKQTKQLSTFNLKKLIFRKDGGAIMIMESYFTENDHLAYQSNSHPSFSNFRAYNVYYYNDVICLSISPEGEEEWNTILRKKQISENDNGLYSSFGILIEKDELNFLYLDEIFYSTNINNYVLSSSGKLRRNVLFNQGDENVMLIPKLARQISNDVIIIPSLRKNMLSMVKIDL